MSDDPGSNRNAHVRWRDGAAVLVLTLLFASFTLLAGYEFKAQCYGPSFDSVGESGPDLAERATKDVCYSDLQYLWVARGVYEHHLPYVDGSYDPATQQLVGGSLDYPVLTGMVVYVTGLLSGDDADFLHWNALLLLPCGLLVGFLLCRLCGIRAWWWALAPPLVLYAVHNWDLLAVACVVGAVAAAAAAPTSVRPRSWLVLAAVLLGLGAGFKFYPMMFAVPLAIWVGWRPGRSPAAGESRDDSVGRPGPDRIAAGVSAGPDSGAVGRSGSVLFGGALLAIAVAVFVAVNAPFMIAGFQGWWASFQFQWSRPIDGTTQSIWYYLFLPDNQSDPAAAQARLARYASLATGVGLVAGLVGGWVRARRTGSYPFLPVCGAMLAGYLLLNKVHSPQYALWLVPFFVLLRIRAPWIVAYFLADLAIDIGYFRWQYAILSGRGTDIYNSLPVQAVVLGVWGRAALLACLFVVFLRSESAVMPHRAVRGPIPSSV